MVVLSLLMNVAVLVPVCAGLMLNASWTIEAYGDATPARSILLSVYLAIGVASAVLLVRQEPAAIAALLAVQVAYKLTSPLTVGTLANPVVISNLAIAALHSATLASLWWCQTNGMPHVQSGTNAEPVS